MEEKAQYINKFTKGVPVDVKHAILALDEAISCTPKCAMFGMGRKGTVVVIEFETGTE